MTNGKFGAFASGILIIALLFLSLIYLLSHSHKSPDYTLAFDEAFLS